MCIRDSFCDFENVALGVRDAQYEKFDIKPVLERLLAKGSICLLYTSDAADERSSVDLGGRRIIKKKNNLEHGCR